MTHELKCNRSSGQASGEESSVKKVLTRRQLYDRVWTTPMRTLAKEFGLSDVGLAKACQRYNIPRPPVGYWAKVEHGKRVPKPALTANDELDRLTINFGRQPETNRPVPVEVPKRECDSDVAAALESVKASLPIQVAEALEDPHEFVASTERALKQAVRSKICDRQGLTHPPWRYGGPAVEIKVAETSIPRALRIANGLIRGAAACGFKVLASEVNDQSCVRIEVLSEQFKFSIREHVNQVPHVLTAEEKAREKKHGYDWFTKKVDYVPRGEFSLTVCLADDHYCSKSWKDGKRKRLEDMIGDVLEGMPWIIQRERKRRAEAARWQEEWRRKEQARLEEEHRQQKEQERINVLLHEVDRWRKVDGIRTYIHAVEEAMRDLNQDSNPKVQEWLAWANRVAGQFDPIESIRKQFGDARPAQPR